MPTAYASLLAAEPGSRPGLGATVAPALRAVSSHPRPVLMIIALTAALVAGEAWRRTRSAIADRVTLGLVPTDAFDPSPEELRRWAAAIAATRRWWIPVSRRATAVRFRLASADGGRVEMTMTCPSRAVRILEAACPHQVEMVRVEPVTARRYGWRQRAAATLAPSGGEQGPDRSERRLAAEPPVGGLALLGCPPEQHSQTGRGREARGQALPRPMPGTAPLRGAALVGDRHRAELVLGRGVHGLSVLGLAPDPLVPLVAALGDLGDGETGEVVVDLMAVSPTRRRRELRAAVKDDRQRSSFSLGDPMGALVAGLNADPVGRGPAGARDQALKAGRLERREDTEAVRERHDRLSPAAPAFAVQVLITATGPRAVAAVDALVAGMAASGGRNAWRRAGVHLGPLHLGTADSAGRRYGFDRRLATGWFAPRRRSVVTAAEIAGLLKPPTKHCASPAVRRSGGLVPPPPVGLPTWAPGVPGLWPLGTITEGGVPRIVGVPLESSLFSLTCGSAGHGKTAPSLVRMAALAGLADDGGGARGRAGMLYIDPHADGIEALRGYLVAQADRVTEFDLSREDSASQGAWNPLDMTGADASGIGRRVSLFTAAYSTLVMSRGLTLVTMAVTALCELNLQLPPHLQCTVFQIPTLLGDERWRAEVVRFLSSHSQSFWAEGGRIGKQSGGSEATGPVTNPIDRLRSSRSAAALFGQPRSSFDMRRTMDAGGIVLVCPGLGEDKDQLVMGLFLFELHLAARSRRSLPVAERRPFHAWVDEMQIADRGEGAAVLAQMVQQDRKFGLRLHGLVQQPTSLQRETLTAVLTNRSHLMTSAVGYESAAVLAREMGAHLEPGAFTHLPKFSHLASVTHQGQRSAPFRLGGLYLEDVFGPPASASDLAAMEAVIDRSMGRRPTSDVLAELDTLDGRIIEHLRNQRPRPSGTVDGPGEPRRGQRRLEPVAPAERGWHAG